MKKLTVENQIDRPIGVWCLSTNGGRFKSDEWSCGHTPQGVLVVTPETAFIVAPHASAALQWGALEEAKGQLVKDVDSLDSKAATDAMLAAYEGAHHQDEDGKIWDVYGAPAAQWCREYACGNIGAGGWDLPTVAVLKIMHEHRDEINECLTAIGGYRLSPGWYWSSIEYSPSAAWFVYVTNGHTDWYGKVDTNFVRAVSAFQL